MLALHRPTMHALQRRIRGTILPGKSNELYDTTGFLSVFVGHY